MRKQSDSRGFIRISVWCRPPHLINYEASLSGVLFLVVTGPNNVVWGEATGVKPGSPSLNLQ